MAADTRIEDVKTLLDAINADDVAEDAAFQATIDGLSTSLATVTTERDAAQSLLAAQEGRITALETQAIDYESRLDLLEA